MSPERKRELFERLNRLREANPRWWVERYSDPAEIERLARNATEVENPKRRRG